MMSKTEFGGFGDKDEKGTRSMQYILSLWGGPWLLGNHLLLEGLTVSHIT